MKDYLGELNPKQREAVLTTEGPVLIVAGAGAGKTKTITHRIFHLIKEGVEPNSILAITFTNKAAKEMRDRVIHLLNSQPITYNKVIGDMGYPFISTFHSLGVHIIKENAALIGVPRHFSIFDKADSKRAVKEAMEDRGVDPKQYEPGRILSIISRQKGNMVREKEFDSASDYYSGIVGKVWARYEEILKREKALDFDDLLLKAATLLSKNEDVRSRYQKVWKYIHIDEYQDTNKVQYMLAKLLAKAKRNICVVGDADQMIYSWRGADITNILNFEKDYPEARVILLEENYRSTKTILAAANRIIEKNKLRKEKKLFTKNEDGEKLSFRTYRSEMDEARAIAEEARSMIQSGVSAREIAVLYRANFQSRALEEAFLLKEVPYQILGTRFFERKEVKDVLSFLRASLNPESLGDIKRIINIPPRGIGKVTLLKIFSGKESELPAAMREKIARFRGQLQRIKTTAIKGKVSDTIKFIITESGLEATWRDGTEEEQERLENVRELVTLASRYNALPPEEAVEKLLTDAALAADQDELMKDRDAVKLMTVHASKGLEFDHVFITGLEEDLFPHKRFGEEEMTDEEAEEERRLFYVALTRARKKVYFSFAQVRTIFGSQKVNAPSQFVGELDQELLDSSHEDEPRGVKAIFIDF